MFEWAPFFRLIAGPNLSGGGLRRNSTSEWFAPLTASTHRSKSCLTFPSHRSRSVPLTQLKYNMWVSQRRYCGWSKLTTDRLYLDCICCLLTKSVIGIVLFCIVVFVVRNMKCKIFFYVPYPRTVTIHIYETRKKLSLFTEEEEHPTISKLE